MLEMVTYKSKSTKMASSQGGTELEALSETHIGDLSEAYNVGVLSPAPSRRSRRFKALIWKWRKSLSASLISSRLDPLKDLGTMHAMIVLMKAEIASWEEYIDILAERAEIAMLTEHAGTDSAQDAWNNLGAARENLDTAIAKNNAKIHDAQRIVNKLANQPPNLILNVHNTFPKGGELWAFVMMGMALQFVAVTIPAIMTYHWREPKGTKPVQDYAYPTFLLGTCLLFVSIALCSYVIEATTIEQVFTPTDDYGVENIFRLQLQQNMGDQPFEAYVILNHAEDKRIRTSRYDPVEQAENSRAKDQKSIVIIAVSLCFVGFICQFVGLRALHWSATVIQLGITLLMTCIRAWIRRGISNQPITFQLPIHHPSWIALSLGTACQNGWPPKSKLWPTKIHPIFRFCEELPETRSVPVTGLISIDDPRIQLRRKLQPSSTTDSDLLPQAQALLSSMHWFLMWLNPRDEIRSRPITWSHIVQSNGLNDSSLQNSRLKLTMSFDYEPFGESKEEVLNRNNLHALLAILKYGSRPSSFHRCLARVYSHKDWRWKKGFLLAHLPESTREDGHLHHIGFVSIKDGLRYYDQRDAKASPYERTMKKLAGTSIENMQPVTASSIPGSSSSYGYLVVRLRLITTANHVLELLAGFMDAACQETSLKYDPMMKDWYVEHKGNRQQMEPDYIMSMFKSLNPIVTEMEARLLVLSSLAQCTVWKDSVLADEPDPASVPLPKPSSRATLQRPSSSQSSINFL